MLFSKKTIVLAFESYNFQAHSEVSKIAEMFNLDGVLEGHPQADSINKKLGLMREAIYTGALNEANLLELIQYLSRSLLKNDTEFRSFERDMLIRSLAADGFSFDDESEKLIKIVPQEVIEAKEQVFLLLEQNEDLFKLISQRMEQSLQSFRESDYKKCILDLRLTSETIVKKLTEAKNLHLNKNNEWKDQNELRMALGNTRILDKTRNLVNNKSKGLFNGLYNYLSSFLHAQNNLDQIGEIEPTKEDALLAIQMTFPLIHRMVSNYYLEK